MRLADVPGSLHVLTGLVAEAGANIVRLEVVSHERDDVWDDIELAAGSEGQLQWVMRAIRDTGVDLVGLPEAWTVRDWAVEILHSLEALGEASDGSTALDEFVATAMRLTNTQRALVLMEPPSPDTLVATRRWELIEGAAEQFDPDHVEWRGNPLGVRFVSSAMNAARSEPWADDGVHPRPVGAVVRMPAPGKRPAHLAVIGRRPPFLNTEVERLELFARVGAPHMTTMHWEDTA